MHRQPHNRRRRTLQVRQQTPTLPSQPPMLHPNNIQALLPQIPKQLLHTHQVFQVQIQRIPKHIRILRIVHTRSIQQRAMSKKLPTTLHNNHTQVNNQRQTTNHQVPQQSTLQHIPTNRTSIPRPQRNTTQQNNRLLPHTRQERRKISLSQRRHNPTTIRTQQQHNTTTRRSSQTQYPSRTRQRPIRQHSSNRRTTKKLILMHRPT